MKNHYVPSVCLGDDAEYEGTITLRAPTYDERLDMLEMLDLLDPDAETAEEMTQKAKEKAQKNQTKVLRYLGKKLPDFLEKVDIRRKSDGYLFDSWDKLQHDSDMIPVIREASTKLVGKYQVGDPL